MSHFTLIKLLRKTCLKETSKCFQVINQGLFPSQPRCQRWFDFKCHCVISISKIDSREAWRRVLPGCDVYRTRVSFLAAWFSCRWQRTSFKCWFGLARFDVSHHRKAVRFDWEMWRYSNQEVTKESHFPNRDRMGSFLGGGEFSPLVQRKRRKASRVTPRYGSYIES